MIANRWSSSWRAITAMIALVGTPAQAQVGLASGVSQIALIAQVPLRASMEHGEVRQTGRYDTMSEISVKVRVRANARYRIVVLGTARAAGLSLWARDVGGKFRELTSGSEVTVAKETGAAGEWQNDLRYRSKTAEPVQSGHLLPVRYEIRVEPTI